MTHREFCRKKFVTVAFAKNVGKNAQKTVLKGTSYEMDFAFDVMYGSF